MKSPIKKPLQTEDIKNQNEALQKCWELRKLVHEKKKKSKTPPKEFS
jgi:hypothetical protein